MFLNNEKISISPTRIQEARIARGLTMADLARMVDVTPQAISRYEKGLSGVSDIVLAKISKKTDFPLNFFYMPEPPNVRVQTQGLFSSNSNLPAKLKDAFDIRIKWLYETRCFLDNYINFFDVQLFFEDVEVPDYEVATLFEIDQFAIDMREKLGLSHYPVVDIVGVLENNGILVGKAASDSFTNFKSFFAYSKWIDGNPYVIYNADIPKGAYNMVFEIAHELGHLLLHNNINGDIIKKKVKELDIQADRFASSFLLPLFMLEKEVFSSSIESIVPICQKWNVPVYTVIKQLEYGKFLTVSQIQYLTRQMGFKKLSNSKAFNNKVIKSPSVFKNSIKLLVENNIVSRLDLSVNRGLSKNDISAVTGLDKGFFDISFGRQQPHLKLV